MSPGPTSSEPGSSGSGSSRAGLRLLPAFIGLASSQLIGTIAGFAFWLVAAKSATPAAVGVAGASVAAVGLLSKVTSLGVGSLFLAELPRLEGPQTHRFVRAGTFVLVVASLVAGGLWWAGASLVGSGGGSALRAAVGSPALGGLFIGILLLTTVAAAWDFGAVAVNKGGAQVTRNVVASVGRMAVLLTWVVVVGEPSATVLLSTWLVPLAVSVAVFAARTGIVSRGPTGRTVAADAAPQFGLRGLLVHYARRAMGHHAIDLSLSVGPLLIPLVAAALLVPRENGFFTMAWMFSTVVFTAPFMLGTALFASSAAGGENAYLRSSRRALPAGLALSASGIVGTWLLGKWALGIFGAEYAEKSWIVVAVLVLAGPAMVVKDVVLDWLRLTDRLWTAAALALGASLVEVVGAVVGGIVGGEGTGVAIGWVVATTAQLIVGLPILVPFLRGVVGAARYGPLT